jgi:4-oxalocrotonate tautomerase
MPFVNVKLVDGVFTSEEKHAMAKELTDVMVKYEGSEAFREVVWVLIEELHTDGWHIGGRPFAGPKSLMENLGHSKKIFEPRGVRSHHARSHQVSRCELRRQTRWRGAASIGCQKLRHWRNIVFEEAFWRLIST